MEKQFIQKATALQYNEQKDAAPKVIAQGSKETAKNIIKIAEEFGIPIKKDEDLVEMLSQIETNREIPVELYQAVAELFSFVYEISNKKADYEKED
ncbi:MAG: EscU/YscU/HrcU family type III secretion system export apparatus switch protein [Campylobacterota bacterium]|nr:EscU/YscU/HrcU family type III secretion system export apparatus switch protein [Campylobacterota bacterium]